jgi:RimJ/RimL family protein N-acetyltransferase
MLNGKIITLRPIRESDLEQYYAYQVDLDNRGEFYGRNFSTLTAIRREFEAGGMWTDEAGVFVLADKVTDRMIGRITWFKTVQYLDEIEIGYILYDEAQRRKGCMTEALCLFTEYLFDTRPVNRIRLCIRAGNVASCRVAEKSGYTHEATQRGAAGRTGNYSDMELYARLRNDPRPA